MQVQFPDRGLKEPFSALLRQAILGIRIFDAPSKTKMLGINGFSPPACLLFWGQVPGRFGGQPTPPISPLAFDC
jgi:hypothetical protein